MQNVELCKNKINFLTSEQRLILLCDNRFDDYRKTIEQLVENIVQTDNELMREGFRMELKRVAETMRIDMFAIFYSNEYQEKGVF